MSIEHALDKQLEDVTEGFRQAEMAHKYKEITEAQGPSQQLIDFINADGKLGEEIGLEGFHAFSTNTQHEILLSKLNPDAMEEVALESFKDFIKKYRGWLIVGSFLLPGIGLPLLAAGVAGIILKRQDYKVIPYRVYKSRIDDLQSDITILEKTISSIPTGNDKEKWGSFKASVSAISEKFEYDQEKVEPVIVTKAGWNVSNMVSELKSIDTLGKKLESIRDSFNSKLGAIESISGDASSKASDAVSELISIFKRFGVEINSIHKELKKVASCFDVASED
jgi:hypothetical protein